MADEAPPLPSPPHGERRTSYVLRPTEPRSVENPGPGRRPGRPTVPLGCPNGQPRAPPGGFVTATAPPPPPSAPAPPSTAAARAWEATKVYGHGDTEVRAIDGISVEF